LKGDLQEFLLLLGHSLSLGSIPLVVVSYQVQYAVDHEEDDHIEVFQTKPGRLAPRRFNRDDQVPQQLGMKERERSLPHGKGKDVRGFITVEVAAVQVLDLNVIYQKNTQLRLGQGKGRQDPISHLF